jgi:hypothetical protein
MESTEKADFLQSPELQLSDHGGKTLWFHNFINYVQASNKKKIKKQMKFLY